MVVRGEEVETATYPAVVISFLGIVGPDICSGHKRLPDIATIFCSEEMSAMICMTPKADVVVTKNLSEKLPPPLTLSITELGQVWVVTSWTRTR